VIAASHFFANFALVPLGTHSCAKAAHIMIDIFQVPLLNSFLL